MKGTRGALFRQLVSSTIKKVQRINSYGVGTIEIKSGYGLNYQKEKELSLAIDQVKRYFYPKVQIRNTFMAAHAVPQEYHSSHQYMDEVVLPLLTELGPSLIDAVDIFHEVGYFSTSDVEKLFNLADKLGIGKKLHGDEFHDMGSAQLAVEHQCLSADHLFQSNESSIALFAESQTIPVLLPGTGFFLGKKQAKAQLFLQSQAAIALASDYNPGSCHCDNLLLIAALAAPNLKLNLAQTWAGITYNSAHALGLSQQGSIEVGLCPRFSLFQTTRHENIFYHWGKNFSRPIP